MMDPTVLTTTGLGTVTSHESFGKNTLMMCRICLQSNGKFLSIESYSLSTAYEQLTGVSVEHDDGLPRELCVECATLLDKYHKFRDKSIRGDQYLKTAFKIKGKAQRIKLNKYAVTLKNKYWYLSLCSITNHIDIPPKQENKQDEIKIEYPQEKDQHPEEDNKKFKTETDPIQPSTSTIKRDSGDDEFDTNSIHSNSSDESDKPLSSFVETKKKTNEKRKTNKNNKVEAKKVKLNRQESKSKIVKPKDMLKEYFKVKILTREEQIKVIEDRKEKHSHAAYKCEFCFKSFANDMTLQLHLVDHSEIRGKEICDICHIHSESVKKLQIHHNNVHKYQYLCVKCDVAFSSRNVAVQHAKWHNGKRYPCKECGIVLERSTSYLHHVRIKHPSNYICSYCGYSFLGHKGRSKHINSRHYEEAKTPLSGPWCVECNVQFATDTALETHNGIKHTNTNRNILIHNGKNPRNVIKILSPTKDKVIWKAVKKDQRQDKGEGGNKEQSIPCEICFEEVPTWHGYRVHFGRAHPTAIRTYFPNTYTTRADNMCEVCGKAYKVKSLLKEHLKTHSTPQYKCSECSKTFFTTKQHRAHMSVHGCSEYVCTVCGCAFKHKSNRNRHYLYVHSTEKPFKCDFCTKSFKSNEQKKLHTRHIHLKEPWPRRSRNKNTGL